MEMEGLSDYLGLNFFQQSAVGFQVQVLTCFIIKSSF